MEAFKEKVERLFQRHEELITRKNVAVEDGNGIFTRYKYPVVTAAHTPVFWRYDLDEKSNPYLMERIGMNATMNSGAIKWNGKYLMVVRVEGADRKSFFARVPTALIISGSGIIPSPCPKTRFRQRMYTTCASRLMRTAGFTVSSAPNATTTMRLPVICPRLRLQLPLPAPRI